MHTIDIVQTVAFLAAFIALASRLFVASRPFWSRCPAWAQTLLPVLVPTLTAAAQGLAGVKSWSDLSVLFVVSAGMLLPGLPSNRSAAPLQAGKDPKLTPSAGDVAVAESLVAKASMRPPPDDTKLPPFFPGGAALLLAIGLVSHTSACGLFGSGSPLWPVVARCAPSPTELVSKALAILLAGGDIESEFLHLAQTAGKDAVICAVREATGNLSNRVGATPERLSAAARGKAFLAETGNQ